MHSSLLSYCNEGQLLVRNTSVPLAAAEVSSIVVPVSEITNAWRNELASVQLWVHRCSDDGHGWVRAVQFLHTLRATDHIEENDISFWHASVSKALHCCYGRATG